MGFPVGLTWAKVGFVSWKYQGRFLRGYKIQVVFNLFNKGQEFERVPQMGKWQVNSSCGENKKAHLGNCKWHGMCPECMWRAAG